MLRLKQLREMLADETLSQVQAQAFVRFMPYNDSVSVEHVRRNLPALMAAIERAERFYSTFVEGPL